MSECKYPGCDRPTNGKGKGWCRAHYMRWWRTGDPAGKKALEGDHEKFIEHVLLNPPEGCAVWPFGTHDYPLFKRRPAHIVVCEQANGPKPLGMEAAHSCGNSRCVNPKHLRWTTHSDNLNDRYEHGTDLTGERNPTAKLTTQNVLDIRDRVSAGETQNSVAIDYGVTRDAVNKIVHRKNWKHV